MRPAFREEELSVLGHYTHVIPVREGVPKLASPITTRENTLLMMNGKKPYWYPMVGMIGGDYRPLRPRMFPDLLVAHDAMDGEPPLDFASLPPIQTGWFDTKWRYVNTVGGPMIEPGSQKIDDMNDWQKLTWPDLDDYDWEGSAERNHDYINCALPVEFCIPTGYWERLMSILEVDLAAVALVDEDQKGAVHAFFDKLTDLYEDYLERVRKYYHAELILMHDDWGHQRSQFFSNETHREMILPYFSRFVRKAHELGMRFELHCCGKAEGLTEHMIEAGVDLWCPQPMNDIRGLAERYRDSGLTFGVTVPIVAPGMPGEEELAEKTAREFAETWGTLPVAYVNYGGSELLYKYMYKYSRIALA